MAEMGTISKLVSFLNVCFFSLGCVLLLPMLFHIHPYTVYSGSMIFVKENVPFAEIKEYDIITFSMGKTTVTHRVEKVEKEAVIIDVKLRLEKRINKNSIDLSLGDPTFLFHIKGRDWKGQQRNYHASITFTKSEIEKAKPDERGYITLSTTIDQTKMYQYKKMRQVWMLQ